MPILWKKYEKYFKITSAEFFSLHADHKEKYFSEYLYRFGWSLEYFSSVLISASPTQGLCYRISIII